MDNKSYQSICMSESPCLIHKFLLLSFSGSNIGATEKQAMNTSQQPIPKPDEFSAFQVGNVQSFSSSSASTSFSASFQVSNTQANFPLPSGFSNQKQPNVTADDDFGDFQG